MKMEEHIRQRVVGQDEAVEALCNAVRRNRAGLGDPHRPIGVFLFLGPTGVGKTELSKALADFLFNDPSAMIRIDMSEFMESHSVARLIGAPPGYVGYEEGGRLTEAVRRKPYSVILLDEVEKAHPDVFNVLLQVFDDARLTDGKGRTVDFKNTVIIMTSNIASEQIQKMTEEKGAEWEIEAHVKEVLKVVFKPEFLNRVDEVIVFHTLNEEHLRKIVDIQLRYLAERIRERKMEVQITDAAKKLITDEGYDPAFGARPMKRVIQQRLENPLASEHLERLPSSIRVAYGQVMIVNPEGEKICLLGEPWEKRGDRFMQIILFIPHQGVMHRRNLFEQHGQFDESFQITGDNELLLRELKTADAFFIPGIIITAMRQGGISSELASSLLVMRETRYAAKMHSQRLPRWYWLMAMVKAYIKLLLWSMLGKRLVMKLLNIYSRVKRTPPFRTRT